jgi:hypothetical protein
VSVLCPLLAALRPFPSHRPNSAILGSRHTGEALLMTEKLAGESRGDPRRMARFREERLSTENCHKSNGML